MKGDTFMSELTLWDELRRCVVNKESFEGTITATDMAELEEARKQWDFNAHMSDDWNRAKQELQLSADIIALARMHMVEE